MKTYCGDKTQKIKVFLFFVIGMVLFIKLQNVFSYKWYYPARVGYTEKLEEFSRISENSQLQVIILGVSHAENAIDPMGIYKASGIQSFNFSSNAQYPPMSYAFCAEAFRHSSPQVVLLDVSSFFRSDNDNLNQYKFVLDTLPLGKNKAELAEKYAAHYPENQQIDALCEALLPIYAYHDRWSQLSASDFYKCDKNYYGKGFIPYSSITAANMNPDVMNNTVKQLWGAQSAWTYDAVSKQFSENPSPDLLYDPVISNKNLAELLTIKQLCEENHAELVLIKVPSIGNPQYYSPAWTQAKSAIMKETARKYQLKFLDLLYDVDLGIDWQYDTMDAGCHLNWLGAKKVTAYLADYLKSECALIERPCVAYEEDIPIYDAVSRLLDLQTTNDLTSYLNQVVQIKDVTVFFSAQADMITNLSAKNRQELNRFGLQTNFDSLNFGDSFAAVWEKGVMNYEVSSNRKIACSGVLNNDVAYELVSSGWLTEQKSCVIINGIEYSLNHRGLNLVVLDNASGLVLDSVAFDTWDVPENQSAIRNNAHTVTFLRDYEQYLMIQDAKNGIGA